jgi:hypothetical protein
VAGALIATVLGQRGKRLEIERHDFGLLLVDGDGLPRHQASVRHGGISVRHIEQLDFSTAERRRVACEAELHLNRRTAPELYLEIRALTRNAQGKIAFAGAGLPVRPRLIFAPS